MTFTSYPFDVGAGAGFANSAAFRALAMRWRGSGVNKGDRNGLAVAAGSGLQTTVASGSGFVQGAYCSNDASVTLSHSAAHATFGRLDLVCLELDLSDLNAPLVEPVVVTGTPSGAPVIPALTQNSTIYQIPLASVLIPALATNVSTITDYRPWAGHRPRLVDGSAGGTATTTSTSYVDMTTMDTDSFYSDGGDIEVTFSGSIWNSVATGTTIVGFSLDGGTEIFIGQVQSDSSNQVITFSARHLFVSVAAGWHRIKVRWAVQTGGGTSSCNNSRRMIWAEAT
jgi:hypothetical protein